MKKSNKTLSTLASLLLLASFIFSPLSAVFADDAAEAPKEVATEEASADAKKAEGGDADKKKAKKGEEPDCD